MDLGDLPAYFDPIERFTGACITFLNADWTGTFRRAGWLGLVKEFINCVTSQNAPTIYFERNMGWSGQDVEQLLNRHGIEVWDRGLVGDELYFCVKRRQARWAEYVMLRAGVPITYALLDPRNSENASHYQPSLEPAQTRKRTKGRQ